MRQERMSGEGFDPPGAVAEIDKAAEAYLEVRDQRIKLTKSETETRSGLIAVMRQHERATYRYNGRTISIETKDKVKVLKDKDEEDGDETE